jgi:hypothetical protein
MYHIYFCFLVSVNIFIVRFWQHMYTCKNPSWQQKFCQSAGSNRYGGEELWNASRVGGAETGARHERGGREKKAGGGGGRKE